MAYMNQTRKATIAAKVKPILAKYGVKGTLSVRNGMTIVLTLTSGKVDFIGDLVSPVPQFGAWVELDKDKMRKHYEINVNVYHYETSYTGAALAFMREIMPALKGAEWYDRSDIMTDYFDTAYYIDVRVGKWNKPYILTK